MSPPGELKSRHLDLGTVIDGRYQIEGLLGEGGFGVVYLAKQTTTGQQVAVKVLNAQKLSADDGAELEIARFHREMELVARLRHPNIVRLIDSGRLSAVELYQVLEYVEGDELATVVRNEGALPPAEAKDLMFQVLDALSAAHQLGIVHRDMKPQNIMITGSGFRRNAMVLDFGIAGIASDARDQDYKTLTMEGRIHGTPSYMAPEQLKGERTSPLIDVYAWGLVFTEVLTGRKIMARDSFAEVIAAVMSTEPVSIPAELMQHPLGPFLARCTEKDASRRFQSAHEALEALQNIDIKRNERFSWTGTSASDQTMASGSLSGPMQATSGSMPPNSGSMAAEGAGHGHLDINSQPTAIYQSDSLSTTVQAPRKKVGLAVAIALGALLVVGAVVAWIVAGDNTETGEASAAQADGDTEGEAEGGPEGQNGDAGSKTKSEEAGDPDEERSAATSDVDPWEDGEPHQKDRGGEMRYVAGGTLNPGGSKATSERILAHCREIMGKHAKLCEPALFHLQKGNEPVNVEPFLLDVTEVSQAQWEACSTDGSCPPLDWVQCHALTSKGPFGPHGLDGKALDGLIAALSGDKKPAICVTRTEATMFCEWAGKRLPSSHEFEWAATRGEQSLYPWGDASEEGGRRANGADPSLAAAMAWDKGAPIVIRSRASDTDGHAFLAPVDSFSRGANKQGVLNLAGNVREWVTDAQVGEGLDAAAPANDAVARGGSWAEPGPWLSGRTRTLLPASSRRTDLGFRCAANLPAAPPETP